MLKKNEPKSPANKDPTRRDRLPSSIIVASVKDNMATKIDMVKPTHANKATPNICFHEAWSGRLDKPKRMHNQQVVVMTTDLPTMSPTIMPRPTGDVKPPTISLCKVMAVLAKAKIGMINRFTGVEMACSKRSNGDIPSFATAVGTVIAVNTPAMVACIPEWWIKYQINIPGIM